jgi:hypothetical protein
MAKQAMIDLQIREKDAKNGFEKVVKAFQDPNSSGFTTATSELLSADGTVPLLIA